MSSSQASGSSSKRQKNSDGGGPPQNGSYHQGPPFSQQQFPPYGGGGAQPSGGQQQFPMQHQSGYMWQPGQQPPPYGNQMAPVPHWQSGQQGPNGMFRQSPPPGGPPNGPPIPLDRSGNNWNGGYRGQPPPQGSGPPQGRRSNGKQSSQRSGSKSSGSSGAGMPSNVPPGGPYQSWGQPQQQWAQNQWGGGPPPPQMWQGGPSGPSMHPPQPSPPPGQSLPQHMKGPMGPMNPWPGGGQGSPKRQSKGRPRGSPDPLMGAGLYPPQSIMMSGMPSDVMCKPIGMDGGPDQDIYITSQGVGTGLDDDNRSKQTGGSSVTSRDKGRGSYRCGRCGVPKKGHVCPYQPKLKRRPDEPPPETRNAAIQVEMDEFMTLRRLNIEIQGFPESYATGSHMMENTVIGEPHPLALGDAGVISHGGYMGNEPAQVSVPSRVASQSTVPAEELDGEVRTSPPTTTESETTMEMPQAEQEKTMAV